MLQNEYLLFLVLAKIGADTAENDPKLNKMSTIRCENHTEQDAQCKFLSV